MHRTKFQILSPLGWTERGWSQFYKGVSILSFWASFKYFELLGTKRHLPTCPWTTQNCAFTIRVTL